MPESCCSKRAASASKSARSLNPGDCGGSATDSLSGGGRVIGPVE